MSISPSALPGQEVARAAERILESRVLAISPAGAGANSRIFCVDTAAGRFAVKSYPERRGDTRARAEVEWQALTFMRGHGLSCVPEPIGRDADGQYLAMEWISGTPVAPHQLDDVAHAAKFVTRIFALSAHPDAAQFPLASEACLSAAEIVQQIERRLTRFVALPPLVAFLQHDFRPALTEAKKEVSEELSRDAELEPASRRLIPADFGFHNALRESDGALRYIDFDYFGWDDPVKLTADFLLHPAMQLAADHQDCFWSHIVTALPDDTDFAPRLLRHLPLYALRWALILLNPFRADRGAKTPSDARDEEGLLASRIEKARTMTSHARRLLDRESNGVHARLRRVLEQRQV